MKKTRTITKVWLAAMVCAALLLSACASNQGANNNGGGGGQSSDVPDNSKAPQPTESEIGKITSGTVSFDFSFGSPESDIQTVDFQSYSESITYEEMMYELSSISGLDFNVTIAYEDGRTIVEWAEDSTLVAGLDDREMKEGYTFSDAESLRWFMMDSVWRTLNSPENLYYTMSGGKDLVFEELYPTNIFPADSPYMGSAFYFAQFNEIPEDFVPEISYTDSENGLILYYPESFAAQPENPGESILRFPALTGDIVLEYWVTPNDRGETPETFAENAAAEEIYHVENTVIGWIKNLDQESGEVTPAACYWLVEQDWIACAAVLCQTEKQAETWCGNLMVKESVRIEKK